MYIYIFSPALSSTVSKLGQQILSPSVARVAHFAGLHLLHKDFLQAEVVTFNAAGGSFSAKTDGVQIDLTPPSIAKFKQVANARCDVGFQVKRLFVMFLTTKLQL